jgi:hypothetical protein
MKTLQMCSIRIPSLARVFVQASVLLTDNRKDTSLQQNLSISCYYTSIIAYGTAP